MSDFLAFTVIGLCTGGMFAVAASGLVLTYTTTGIFNFSHGAIGMLGAFTYWQLHVQMGLPSLVSLLLVLLVAAPALGAFIEVVIMRNLRGAPETARLVVSVAMLAGMLSLGQWLWPTDRAYPVSKFFPDSAVRIFDVNVSYHDLIGLGTAGAVALGLRFLLFSTRSGMTMRAAVDDRSLVQLNGANPDRSSLLAWAVGCSLAALAGILLALQQTQVVHLTLTLLVVNAYAAALFGKLRNLPLTFAGALVLGVLDAWGVAYLPQNNTLLQSFRPAIPVMVLFLVLVLLPSAQLRGVRASRQREVVTRPGWRHAWTMVALILGTGLLLASQLSDTDAIKAGKGAGIALIAMSLVPLVGYGGQLCLCQMSFAAIGAISMGQLGAGGEPYALVVGAVIAAAIGALIALPALRLSSLELALATAAFAVILERWVFTLPTYRVGPVSISFFDRSAVAVPKLHVPGLDPFGPKGQLIVISVFLGLAYLLVVAIRRSAFGDRLLALKESPAACATLGMNPVATRLAVFALSAAMAAVGGGLYAGTLGSVSPDMFNLFQSLPLLLLAVAGGVTTPGGAIMAGVTLGLLPVLIAKYSSIANLLGLVPGTIGITLGRNPNGAVLDMAARTAAAKRSRILLLVTAGGIALFVVLWATGILSGWLAFLGGFLTPFITARSGEASGIAPEPDPLDGLDLAGLDREWTEADRVALDRALALDEVRA